ncbi:MAG: hypothetical protein JWM25_1857 [Thermoleophilia bacterium]|nr:hypothetical protein [Thermoleophilia bacterium]MCZ4497272.1 hypothetical protein [Thermoleophilia bacterium]
MPSEQGVRERAAICQDCWFWREMSCALPDPASAACANRRPVRGRQAQPAIAQPAVAQTPMAQLEVALAQQPAPFSDASPEATFSLAQLRDQPASVPGIVQAQGELIQHVRTTPPSFREIRSGRAAAAARMPVAEVRIAIADLDSQPALPGMEGLVERVRQRTAARLSHAAASRATPSSI